MRLLRAGLIALVFAAIASAQCGIVPIKPIVPIGCKDLRPECVCDAHGQNCRWDWVCVK
jgi:hypothetical protein